MSSFGAINTRHSLRSLLLPKTPKLLPIFRAPTSHFHAPFCSPFLIDYLLLHVHLSHSVPVLILPSFILKTIPPEFKPVLINASVLFSSTDGLLESKLTQQLRIVNFESFVKTTHPVVILSPDGLR